jgi:4-carboxymuconolactone decarboxylase
MPQSAPPRIPPVAPPYSDEVGTMLKKWMAPVPQYEPLKIFRTLAHHPALAQRTGVLGAGLLGHPTVTPREREIVIHRMTARCGAEYEWGVHVTIYGRALGFTDAHLRAFVHGDASDPVWAPRERLLIRLADALHETATLSDELWAELSGNWKLDQLIELVVTAGWYRTISNLINVSRVELEDWAERFPAADEVRS